MDTWNQDPKQYLVMHLKLRSGVQFSNSEGKIETSLPDHVEAKEIEPWQYQMMLSLDGEEQFLSVVKSVKNKFPEDFEATEVWSFLYWLIDNELLDQVEPSVEDEAAVAELLPESIEPASETRSWVRVPLQLIAILIVCSCIMYATYITKPMLIAYFNQVETTDPLEEIAADVEEINATRMPQFADQSEANLAGLTQDISETTEVEDTLEEFMDPELARKLKSMRQELAACQIRRNEYYLLNDEDGYSKEVAQISELAKEIGRIQANLEPETGEPKLAEVVEPIAGAIEAQPLESNIQPSATPPLVEIDASETNVEIRLKTPEPVTKAKELLSEINSELPNYLPVNPVLEQ